MALSIAVLTLSDTRTHSNDKSGDILQARLEACGHRLAARRLLHDERAAITACISAWISDRAIDVIITTGGTGFAARDVTPEAVLPLLDKKMDGFSVLFHHVSMAKIGTSTIQSRALAGLAGNTLIFVLPGSPGACRDAWDAILAHQLDHRHRPCNLVEIIRPFGLKD